MTGDRLGRGVSSQVGAASTGEREAVSVYPARFEYFVPTTPSTHHTLGAMGVGESATVGSPDMPMTPDKVREALNEVGLAE